jgi:actin-related protein 3
MGFAGNYEPNYIVPTLISVASEKKAQGPQGGGGVGSQSQSDTTIPDLDFYIGDQANEKRLNYNIDYPIRHGIVDNWDNMEKYWQRCIYQVRKEAGQQTQKLEK